MTTTLTIPDTKSIAQAVDGNKTYFFLLFAAAIIVGNHFGLIPPQYVPASVQGGDWITQLYALAIGGAGRSALKKLEADTMTPAQADKAEALAQAVAPGLAPLFDALVKQWAVEAAAKASAAQGEQKPAG